MLVMGWAASVTAVLELYVCADRRERLAMAWIQWAVSRRVVGASPVLVGIEWWSARAIETRRRLWRRRRMGLGLVFLLVVDGNLWA